MATRTQIEELLEKGLKQKEIANLLNVSQPYVSYIKRGTKGRLVLKKSQAKSRNIEWNIDESDIFYPEKCPLLEIPIDYTGGKDRSYWPSIDRKDPTKGYVKGNVWIISYKANRLKNDGTIEELNTLVNNLNILYTKDKYITK